MMSNRNAMAWLVRNAIAIKGRFKPRFCSEGLRRQTFFKSGNDVAHAGGMGMGPSGGGGGLCGGCSRPDPFPAMTSKNVNFHNNMRSPPLKIAKIRPI
jgi:hypothetical protein